MSKGGPVQDDDVIAQILVSAIMEGDEAASSRHHVSERTIRRYRARMRIDAHLAGLVQAKKSSLEREWTASVREAMNASVQFLTRAATESDPKDPDAVHAVAGALKILAETALTAKVIDARLAAQDRERGAVHHEVDDDAPEEEGVPPLH